MIRTQLALALALVSVGVSACASTDDSDPSADFRVRPAPRVTTLALRVHDMDSMVAFYEEAFGMQFYAVDTSGLDSRFGELDGLLLKFVPLRDSAEFEEFPSHQLGVEVDDVDRVRDIAVKHGGRREGDVLKNGGQSHAAVRDPDGNTIELYGPLRTQGTR